MTKKLTIPRPTVAPFGGEVSAEDVRDVWETFVKPDQEAGKPQSGEMRVLMGILRAVHQGLSDER